MIQNLPPGVTEHEVLKAIEDTVRLLAPQFAWGGMFGVDDLMQEGRIECLRVLARYDPRPDANGKPTRPLPNFFYTCTRNFFVRLKRDRLRRSDPPCRLCSDGVPHERGQKCDAFDRWKQRNDRKASLAKPFDVDLVQENVRVEADVAEEVEVKELLAIIDRHLPLDLRADYLAMRAGVPLDKRKRVAVEEAVKEILGDAITDAA